MKVAIVHDFLIKIGGAERVLQVIHKIFPEAPIYTLVYDKKGTRGEFESKDYKIRVSSLSKYPKFFQLRSKFLLSKFPAAIEEFDFFKFDLVISSSNSFAHGIITRPKTLHITYCYSPMRYSWDWAHQYLDENNIKLSLLGLYIRSVVSKVRLWDYCASKRTDLWVAISKTVAKRILKYYRTKSTVIYPPAEIKELLKNKSKPENYYLIVSRLTQYKNIDLAIKAFNKLNLPLYIIGEGSDKNRLKKMAQDNVKFLGWQNETKRNQYLSKCKSLIFAGEDDFGLTPIEAMAAGRPVVALNAGGATETIIAGKTGEFFDDSESIDSIINSINKIENNYSQYKVENCKDRAKEFSTEIFVQKFKKFIQQSYTNYQNEINEKKN